MALSDLLRKQVREKVDKSEYSKVDLRAPEAPIGICAALEKKSFPTEPPTKLIVKREITKPSEFSVYLKTWLHKNPHYKYIESRRSSWSGMKLQYILLDTVRNVKVVITDAEISKYLVHRGSALPQSPVYDIPKTPTRED